MHIHSFYRLLLWLQRDQPLGAWWHYDIEMLSILPALCEGNPLVIGGFPSQRTTDVELGCFLCCFSKLLNKHASCWWLTYYAPMHVTVMSGWNSLRYLSALLVLCANNPPVRYLLSEIVLCMRLANERWLYNVICHWLGAYTKWTLFSAQKVCNVKVSCYFAAYQNNQFTEH